MGGLGITVLRHANVSILKQRGTVGVDLDVWEACCKSILWCWLKKGWVQRCYDLHEDKGVLEAEFNIIVGEELADGRSKLLADDKFLMAGVRKGPSRGNPLSGKPGLNQ